MKGKLRKILYTYLALSLVVFTGCSSDSETTNGNQSTSSGTTSNENSTNTASGDGITLTLWHYYNGNTKDQLDVMINEFNDTVGAEKGIFVEPYSYSSVNDLATAVVASANNEVGTAEMPHIFAAYSDTAFLLSNLGVVAAMDDYFTDEELALFQQDFLNEGRFDSEGSLKIIPVAKSTELMFINETDFQVFSEEAGISLSDLATWEGMAKVAEIYYNWTDALTPDEENDGRALFGVDSEANLLLTTARQLGEEMYQYEGDTTSFGLSETAGRKIWETLMVPYIKEHYAAYGSYRSDDVKSGDLLIYAGSTSSVYYFPNTVELGRADAYDIEGTSMSYPYFEDGEKVAVQQGAGMVVSKTDATYEAACAEFLKWFTSPENNLDFAVSTGYMPVQNQALSYDGVISVMKETGDITQIVHDSLDMTYNVMIPDYEFYSNKPFEGSYDTRNVVRDSVANTITDAGIYLKEQLGEGITREDALKVMTGEEAFQVWYGLLKDAVNEILN